MGNVIATNIKKMNFSQINIFLENLNQIGEIQGEKISQWYIDVRTICTKFLQDTIDIQSKSQEYENYKKVLDERVKEYTSKTMNEQEKMEAVQRAHKSLEVTDEYIAFDNKIKELNAIEHDVELPMIKISDITQNITGLQRLELKKIEDLIIA